MAAGGDTIGKYELGRELGRGAMGIVYRARQRDLDRDVAVKVLRDGLLGDGGVEEAFLREARAAARAAHPGVVTVFEVGVAAGRHFLAMELLPGPSLEQLGAERRPYADAARIVAELARAIAGLHRHGIVHRDLKPGNVLLDAEGRPRITDFGLAILGVIKGEPGGTGTPGYMAPEQVDDGIGAVGPAVDVYALGAVLFYLLTGRPPHARETVVETMIATVREDAPSPRELVRDLPAELAAVCVGCLRRDPARRYRSADAVADDLERWLRGEGTISAPVDIVHRGIAWTRNRPALAAHLLGLGAFFALVLVDHWLLAATERWFFCYSAAVLALWTVLSVVFDRLVRRGGGGILAPGAWCAVDCAGLTAIALAADGAASPLVVVYPLLVVASGHWSRPRVVSLATLLAVLGYAVLAAESELAARAGRPGADEYLLVLTTLLVVGGLVGHQVRRTRALVALAVRRSARGAAAVSRAAPSRAGR